MLSSGMRGKVKLAGAVLALFAVSAGERDSAVPGWQHAAVERLEKAGFESQALGPILQALHEEATLREDQECTKNLRAFTRALWLPSQPGHTMGLEISDQRYFEALPYPDLLDLPPELCEPRFLRLLDEDGARSLDEAVAYVEGLGAGFTCFIYQSQHLPTPDGTGAHGRFFVLVPGPRFDRYVQFGLRDDPSKPLPNSVSVVAIQKLPVARAFFKDLWRIREGGTITVGSRLAQTGKLESCYTCHKQALLPIVPAPATFDAERWGRVLQEIDARMQRQGACLLAGVDQDAYGPGLGPVDSPLRTEAFLRSCAGERVGPEAMDRLKRAMGCARCHDGRAQARLDHPILRNALPDGGTLVHRFVVTYKKMPPGVDLTGDEREALVRCLEQEYYRGFAGEPGLLPAWLLQPGCARPGREGT